MTEKFNLSTNEQEYYCDICHDPRPIKKRTGYSFPPNALSIDHAHQYCYENKQKVSKATLNLLGFSNKRLPK